MKPLIVILLGAAALAAAPTAQTFTGTITDSMCDDGNHAAMRMGPTDAECTVACVGAHAADYVLLSGKDVYVLRGQQSPEPFAGQKVTITGTLDARTKTIQVDSITAARTPARP